MAGPTADHEAITERLRRLLYRAQDAGYGLARGDPAGVVVDALGTVRKPDLFFIRTERLHLLGERDFQGVPDLVIEVLSESTRGNDLPPRRERRQPNKFQRYEGLGIPYYWIADPQTRRVAQYRLGADGRYGQPAVLGRGDELRFPLFPELALSVTRVFAALRQPERPSRGRDHFRIPDRPEPPRDGNGDPDSPSPARRRRGFRETPTPWREYGRPRHSEDRPGR